MKLLDTTLLVDFLRRREGARRVVLAMEERGEPAGTTEGNAFELLLGAYPRGRLDPKRLAPVEKLLNRLEVLPLTRPASMQAAEILSKLRAEGRDIGLLDALIAGVAIASGCDTIVTHDEGFRRVPGMKVETY